ncbi:MAG: aminopeptidase P family protein [Firmicutes bacterium]|nr:aminopeptidase P family protein [Bacillota bacterium]
MNIDRLNALLRRGGYDAIVATSFPNVFYSTGFASLGQKTIAGTKVFSVVLPGNPPRVTAVFPVGEADLAVEELRDGIEVWPFGKFFIEGADPALPGTDGKLSRALASVRGSAAIETLVDLLKHLGLQGCKVAVDESGLTPQEWNALAGSFRGAIAPAFAAWKEIRTVKTAGEIGRLKRAAEITCAAMDHSLAAAREGMTEVELAAVYEKYLLDNGAATILSVVLFGTHSAYPNGLPGNRRLKKGDIIRLDAGCVYQGYHADLARIALFGEPDRRTRDRALTYHKAALEGVRKAVAAMRPGVPPEKLFGVAVDTTRKEGIPHFKRTHVGHGIGAEIYDPPMLREGITTPLEPGMVFCVETPYYELGFGGIQVEDTVVVTEKGAEYLSPPSKEMEVL